jgi:glycosyltransferase 2 family protein
MALINLIKAAEGKRSALLRIIGYGLAVGCLVWVLRDFHIVRALHDMANADWRWVLLGMVFDVASYGFQALRWKLLLTPFGKLRLTRSIRAVFAGLFANLVFPLRPGEFLRSYLISNSEEITLGRVLGSVGVERFIDLVIATAGLAVVSLVVDLPRRFDRVADTLGVVILVLLTIVVLLVLRIELKLGRNADLQSEEGQIPGRAMQALIVLHAMGTAPSFYPAVLTSMLTPLFQALALWAMMRSYGLHLSFLAAAVVLLVINLGVSLPNAPANVGSYQFFCVLGLSVFQVEKTTATGFSIFAFIALTLPFVFLGFAAVLRSGLSLRSMREKVSSMPRQAARRSAPDRA